MSNESTNKVYVTILMQSLEQKNTVLENLLKQTKQQEEMLKQNVFDNGSFEKTIAEKKLLLDKLSKLDEGFQQVYTKVSEELKDNTQKYSELIDNMKQLICQVTQKSAAIEAIEHRNKERLDSVLLKERKRIREYTVSSKTAANYYKNMSKITGGETFFVDKKS